MKREIKGITRQIQFIFSDDVAQYYPCNLLPIGATSYAWSRELRPAPQKLIYATEAASFKFSIVKTCVCLEDHRYKG